MIELKKEVNDVRKYIETVNYLAVFVSKAVSLGVRRAPQT
jgi:hypothetical protein